MSFGYGVGDLIQVGTLAVEVWRSYRDAPASFKIIATELSALQGVIHQIALAFEGVALSQNQQIWLKALGEACSETLKDLKNVIIRYKSLDSTQKLSWDRLQWRGQNIQELRQRLISSTSLMSTFMMYYIWSRHFNALANII